MTSEAAPSIEVLHNENIGVLGHIDAGKTALSE
jgi:translation elongation factor EF-G